jgi:hypothetical protein
MLAVRGVLAGDEARWRWEGPKTGTQGTQITEMNAGGEGGMQAQGSCRLRSCRLALEELQVGADEELQVGAPPAGLPGR